MSKKEEKKKVVLFLLIIILIGAIIAAALYNDNANGAQEETGLPNDGSSTGDSDDEPTNPPDTSLRYTCTDSDGGINFATWGYCEDSYHMAGFPDKCDSQTVWEYYCDTSNICQRTTKECKYPTETCYNGVCLKMPCRSIPSPVNQASCDAGECTSGACVFMAATSFTPASCVCS